MIHQEPKPRPWTVTALVAWAVAGIFWAAVFDRKLGLTDLGSLLLTAVIAWGMWTAKAWAYILTFASVLIVALSLAILLIIDLREGSPQLAELVPGTIGVAVLFALLLHPTTKRFALHSRNRAPAPTPETTPEGAAPAVGVRRNTIIALVFLLAAIAIGGVLGVLRLYSMTG
jgi:hypothetical protein